MFKQYADQKISELNDSLSKTPPSREEIIKVLTYLDRIKCHSPEWEEGEEFSYLKIQNLSEDSYYGDILGEILRQFVMEGISESFEQIRNDGFLKTEADQMLDMLDESGIEDKPFNIDADGR